MPRLSPGELAYLENHDDVDAAPAGSRPTARKSRARGVDAPFRPVMRRNENQPFRCGKCRVFVGQTVSGGKHRNHCPFCLASRHVDLRRPGDRESPCRAIMPVIGVAFRADGEQMLIHRCNGCGVVRQNRIAADDDPVAVMRLTPAPLPHGRSGADEDTTPGLDEMIARR
ncbi:MAG: RNHCP domain-containing protein [Thermomicrobiales bacterium]